uniref:Erythromycin biosynthesis protein CIII-like C-terminal domain-containing protein n=1 Tax=Chaetoceros debilis TaxID=122233 RepID=A0A7S3V838_9STRA|mmetsp:Transcript_27322/g.40388  ORF Transcript_27322/g.40388 Transcript_27322/m.40388 type:complete len:147 (-) Transcript_27322:175-615(-)|eukprot:CAMPEP_0194092502 /NCGR_PEP_ID=MMETSP0149-20130528/46959_1 /TAXON_ID=122233 /ORGANISM="Chaetoceros debilis, Strain MM31A-1" /LENGTH=146 /DNA_ID=CAMNT_0038777461 /DNA_START=479 /DNA_END=919 /DNA_ORIENTATION=-
MRWGSLTCKSPEYMVTLAVEALQEANQRGVILEGLFKLSMDLLQKATTDKDLISYAETNICFIEMTPHGWLFSRVAAVVHHGSAGTINTSLRSGVPTIITPIFLDQFDMSYVIEELGVGVGFSKQFQQITAKELGYAIKRVLEGQK